MSLDEICAILNQHSPRGVRGLDPHSDEGEGGLIEDEAWDGKGGVDDDGAEKVWDDVAEENGPVAKAEGASRLYIFHLGKVCGLGAHDPTHT